MPRHEPETAPHVTTPHVTTPHVTTPHADEAEQIVQRILAAINGATMANTAVALGYVTACVYEAAPERVHDKLNEAFEHGFNQI